MERYFLRLGLAATLFVGFGKLIIVLTRRIVGYSPVDYSWWWVILPVAIGYMLEEFYNLFASFPENSKDEQIDSGGEI